MFNYFLNISYLSMKNILFVLSLLCVTFSTNAQSGFKRKEVKEIMGRVADWQMANPPTGNEHDAVSWTNATLYMGMLDWAELKEKEDGDTHYYKWLKEIGRKNFWQVGKYMYHADFIAVSQAYIDMYKKYGDRNMLLPTIARTEFVINHPSDSNLELDYRNMATLERWSWCARCSWLHPYMRKCIC